MEAQDSHFILHWLVSGLAVLLTAMIIPGFKVSGYISACIAALVIGLANAVLWPLLIILTLPLNILTLGLFTFVVNGMVLKICAWFLPGFEISSWFSAIFGAIALSLVSLVLHSVLF